MRIHKEGRKIIRNSLIIFILSLTLAIINGLNPSRPGSWVFFVGLILAIIFFVYTIFCLYFFRVPKRPAVTAGDKVFAPADGTVVVVEEVEENEYLNDKRIQVSIFMSLWNVHVNWFPVGGAVEYFRHHEGCFLVAWHPKSSENNERTTVVVDTGHEKILFRQIAGFVARRIVSFASEGKTVTQNSQCGIIKFGSRVDLFLPLDSKINVKLGDKVKGAQTVIAGLNRRGA